MSDETFVQAIIALGIFFGALFRTALPYLKKMKSADLVGMELKFKPKYYATATLSVIASVFVVIEGITIFSITYPELSLESVLTVFPASVMFGYGFNSVLNRFFDLTPDPVEEEEAVKE